MFEFFVGAVIGGVLVAIFFIVIMIRQHDDIDLLVQVMAVYARKAGYPAGKRGVSDRYVTIGVPIKMDSDGRVMYRICYDILKRNYLGGPTVPFDYHEPDVNYPDDNADMEEMKRRFVVEGIQ